MPVGCFAPNCHTGHSRKNEAADKIALFSVPKDQQLFAAWQRAVPRADKKLDKNSKICEKHFRSDEILTHFTSTTKDVEFSIERGRKKLAEGAIPSQWPGCPAYMSKPNRRKRKPPTRRDPPVKKSKHKNPSASAVHLEETVTETVPVIEFQMVADIPESVIKPADPSSSFEVKLPTGWIEWKDFNENSRRLGPNIRLFFNHILKESNNAVVYKSVLVNTVSKTVSRSVMSNPIPNDGENWTTFTDTAELEEMLHAFNHQKLCRGIGDAKFRLIGHVQTGECRQDIWRSRKCTLLCEENKKDICKACFVLKRTLSQRLRRQNQNDSNKSGNLIEEETID